MVALPAGVGKGMKPRLVVPKIIAIANKPAVTTCWFANAY